jgi:hypothetical protein
MKTPTPVEDLHSHPLVQEVFPEAVRIQKALKDRNPIRVEPDYERDPDEHEFYVLAVGHALAELPNLAEQIAHAALYLSRFTQTAATRRAGITRDKHLLYHIENRLIRLHSAFDRSLFLVDAVFHLTNAPAAVSFSVVASNLRVKRTAVSKKLKAIRKVLGPTIDTRNEVIHHHAFKDDTLRELQMYCLFESMPDDSEPFTKSNVRGRIRELTRDLVRKKTTEFAQVDADLLSAMADLLTELLPIYRREKGIIRARVGS